jgi:hypothetical protein
MKDSQDSYLGSAPASEAIEKLEERKRSYYEYLNYSGRRELIENSLFQYYKPAIQKGKVEASGVMGEFKDISVNHYRNLIRHTLTAVGGSRLWFEPKAANTDWSSISQVKLCKKLLEYYVRNTNLESIFLNSLEMSQLCGDSFVHVEWDFMAGDFIGTGSLGEPIYSGDLKFSLKACNDVMWDLKSDDNPDWYCVKDYVNKFDLAAMYPDKAEAILESQPISPYDISIQYLDKFDYDQAADSLERDNSKVAVYTFYHKKSPAVVDGRMLKYISKDVVIFDGALPIDEIPVFKLSPGKQLFNQFGYSGAFDILPLQIALEKLHSTVLTNQSAFGVQSIALPRGSAFNAESLADGLIVIEYDINMGKPEALNLTKTPPEVFNYIDQLGNAMQLLIGIPSTIRGEPDANLRSASAIALVQSIAVQYSQVLELSYSKLVEGVVNSAVKFLQNFVPEERAVFIAGAGTESEVLAFKGDALSQIKRVYVDRGNPLMRTISGRLSIAEMQLQYGLIKDPMKVNELLEHGRLEVTNEKSTSQAALIQKENEMLMKGQIPSALITDDHMMHIEGHKLPLDNPMLRMQGGPVLESFLMHIREHEMLAMQLQQSGGLISMIAMPQMQMEQGQQNQAPTGVAAGDGTNQSIQPQSNMEEKTE